LIGRQGSASESHKSESVPFTHTPPLTHTKLEFPKHNHANHPQLCSRARLLRVEVDAPCDYIHALDDGTTVRLFDIVGHRRESEIEFAPSEELLLMLRDELLSAYLDLLPDRLIADDVAMLMAADDVRTERLLDRRAHDDRPHEDGGFELFVVAGHRCECCECDDVDERASERDFERLCNAGQRSLQIDAKRRLPCTLQDECMDLFLIPGH